MLPLQDFDFAVLDDPEFKEDSVREEIVAPLLRALGYRASGSNRVVRSRRLEHPYVAIGATQQKVSIIPDYMLFSEGAPTWILDAKSPRERVDDPAHDAQVYSYAIHRDVRVDWYAVCNGREFALFHVQDMSAVPRLRFSFHELGERWAEIHTYLWPGGYVHDRDKLDKDYGILLLRLGMKEMAMHYLGVPLLHPYIGRLIDGPYRLARALKIENQRYAVSFDFDAVMFARFLSLLPVDDASGISAALKDENCGVHVAGDLGKINLECRLGELEENADEHFIPLRVLSVSR